MSHKLLFIIAIVLILIAPACSHRQSSPSGESNNTAVEKEKVIPSDAQLTLPAYLKSKRTLSAGKDYNPHRIIVEYQPYIKRVMSRITGAMPKGLSASQQPNSILRQNSTYEQLTDEIAGRFNIKIEQQVYFKDINYASFSIPVNINAEKIMESITNNFPFEIRKVDYDMYREVCWTPNDPDYKNQADYLWGHFKVDAGTAWDTTKGSSSVLIAIVDTGYRMTHEDLANTIDNTTKWPDKITDLVDKDNTPDDQHGHGSFIGGIINATANNAKGVVGVAHGCGVFHIKISETGQADDSDIVAACLLANFLGAKIINLSWGGYGYNDIYERLGDILYDNDVLWVVAAGNSNSAGPYNPAAVEEAFCVGATGPTDKRSSFSNWGEAVDIAAPGEQTKSAGKGSDTEYVTGAGTSYAAPYVSAVAGLVWSNKPTLTAEQMRSLLMDTGTALYNSSQFPKTPWVKIVNANNALKGSNNAVLPSCSITNPKNGDKLNDSSTAAQKKIQVTASDTGGSIDRVEFYVNRKIVSIDKTSPYEHDINPAQTFNGRIEIEAVAFDNNNNRAKDKIVIQCDFTHTATPKTVDFESSPTDWNAYNYNEDGTSNSAYWRQHTAQKHGGSNSYSVQLAAGGYNSYELDVLCSPIYSTGKIKDATVQFWYYNNFNTSAKGEFFVYDGEQYHYIMNFVDQSKTWTSFSKNLSEMVNGYLGKDLQFVWVFESGYQSGASGYGWWIDDFSITGNTVTPPTVTITAPTENSNNSGIVTLTATVTKGTNNVDAVRFYWRPVGANGYNYYEFTASPYTFNWNSKQFWYTPIEFWAVAFDNTANMVDRDMIVFNSANTRKTMNYLEGWETVTIGNQPSDDWYINSGTWNKDSTTKRTGLYSMKSNTGSDYGASANSVVMSPAIQLPEGDNISFEYYTKYDVKANDYFKVFVRLNESYDVLLKQYTNTSNTASWTQYTTSLTPFCGQTIRLVFQVTSDATSHGQGWWIDDLQVFSNLPQISTVTPDRWKKDSGDNVTLTGFSFGGTQGSSQVQFWDGSKWVNAASYSSWNNTTIVCKPNNTAKSNTNGIRVYRADISKYSDPKQFTVVLPNPNLGDLDQL